MSSCATMIRVRTRFVRCLVLLPMISSSHGLTAFMRLPTRTTPLSDTSLFMSTRGQDTSSNLRLINSTAGKLFDPAEADLDELRNVQEGNDNLDLPKILWNQVQESKPRFKPPPLQVEDANLLLYDIFLLLNLSVSISFWVVHRMQPEYIALAFNEGCLMSILWVIAGLYHGAFLYSAVDGHVPPSSMDQANRQNENDKESSWWESLSTTKAGPSAAGLLALNTFINTISLRLIVALSVAFVEHRPVFDDPLEQLIPLEVGFGLILMSAWRTIHSVYVPRM